MKEQALEMLRQAIEAIENGSAEYVILGVLGEEEEDAFSFCAGTTEAAFRAEKHLQFMLDEVRSRPRGVLS
jgi:hypothetical protein